ncbi:class I SAM-dependent methyltransferase [Methylobacterium durans]|uniref:Class I SAM-dependent methyltransferase n=1 Tax=Methylobacterium durans TaxID=2202825 RepID=A0A2U8WDQ5_9HYPH|nr:class I SAM-dependent methyltransferase [Methylobacterium durans]AWN43580.1 hypothetical protein DK389_27585 [Methylobacterium durans]
MFEWTNWIQRTEGNRDEQKFSALPVLRERRIIPKKSGIFLKTAWTPGADYVFIISGGCSVTIPAVSNVRVFHRRNIGFDFGAYEDVFKEFVDPDAYDYIFFVNCTVRGPFLPTYCEMNWTDVFKTKLTLDTKIVGATINILHAHSEFAALFRESYHFRPCGPVPHVQSMMFAVDRSCMAILKEADFFNRGLAITWVEAIIHYELLLSQVLIEKGYNIACLLPEYELDYRVVSEDINPTSWEGNAIDRGAYFGRSLHPYETVFFKNNRGTVEAREMESLTSTALTASEPRQSFLAQARIDSALAKYPSAWTGHKNFATWLVKKMRAQVVVDLGVDYGFSTFCFGAAGAAEVVGIDAFEGDEHAGRRDTYSTVLQIKNELKFDNVSIIRGRFNEISREWSRPIDILHIDGRHNYDDVRADYLDWIRHININGVVLLHDVCVSDFGVRRFFEEIDSPKLVLLNSFGLGVISRSSELIFSISELFSSLIEPGSLHLKADL